MASDAGWYADPSGRHELRWWSGLAWADTVADNGVQVADPLDLGGEFASPGADSGELATGDGPASDIRPAPSDVHVPGRDEPAGRSLAEDLTQLAQLHSAGALSDDEYQVAKRDVLASVQQPAAERRPSDSSSSSTAKKVALLVSVCVVVAAIAFGAVQASNGSSPKKKVAPPTKTIAQRTTETAAALRAALCSGSTDGCVVDGSSPGAVSVTITSVTIGKTELAAAGNQTGLWSNADAARMVETRALDGTQRTADGSVSWTYHPDNGLQLVIDVSK